MCTNELDYDAIYWCLNLQFEYQADNYYLTELIPFCTQIYQDTSVVEERFRAEK